MPLKNLKSLNVENESNSQKLNISSGIIYSFLKDSFKLNVDSQVNASNPPAPPSFHNSSLVLISIRVLEEADDETVQSDIPSSLNHIYCYNPWNPWLTLKYFLAILSFQFI